MANSTNYRCPSCTGPLHFSSSSNRLECDYCGSSYTIEEMDKLYGKKVAEDTVTQNEKQKQAEEKAKTTENWDEAFVQSYNCTTCGAELICEKTTVATSCPYCGNPTIIPGQFKGGRMPDLVIPFKINKEQAVEALKNHYHGKRFLPKVFSSENHIEEIKGVYVPFWLYSGKATGNFSFAATKTHSFISGKYQITETSHFNITRAGDLDYTRIPVDASEKMDNDQMDSVEPFDYSELTKFSPSYLPGFFAESFDESEQTCKPRSDARANQSMKDAIRKTIGYYDTLVETSGKVSTKDSSIEYAFMPVWLLNTKWKDENFRFAMNGQTGKFVGNLPVDWGRFWGHFFAIFAIGMAVITPIAYLLF